MRGLIRSEALKLFKSPVWLLVFVSPLLSLLAALGETVPAADADPWVYTMIVMAYVHALLFLPLLTGVFSAMLCRYEHAGGGWKQLLALPVSRSKVYGVKLLFVLVLLAVAQLLFVGALLLAGMLKGYTAPFPWETVLLSALGGLVACLPLAALQIAVSAAWSSFAAPLAINVIFTLPNILIVNSSEYGPYYPWAQPVLAMMPGVGESYGAFQVGPETLYIVILGSFIVFLTSGWLHFVRKAV